MRCVLACLGLLCLSCGLSAGEPGSGTAAAPVAAELERLNQQLQTAIARAKPACVAVVQRRGADLRTTFSAVIVSREGHVLTAGHCITPGAAYDVMLDDGRTLHAQALGRSLYLDCGMLKITEDVALPFAEMGQSNDLPRELPCLSISHPGGFDSERGLVVRFGRILSATTRGHLHNTCLMEPGDSGGGLFDLEGRLIGIHAYIARDLSDNFDIPIDLFRMYWEQLGRPEDFDPPYAMPQFGIRLKSSRAATDGAEVVEVIKASPAAEAGLLAGDVITEVNEAPVTEGTRIDRVLRRSMRRLDRPLRLSVRRQAETRALQLQRQVPTYASVRSEPSADYEYLPRIAQELKPLESRLDDCAVEIVSTREAQPVSSLGTVIRRDGLIVGKNSCVADAPMVVDGDQQQRPARIVARDPQNDLVLLSVNDEFDAAVDLEAAAEPIVGSLLLSPRPEDADGLVSILGSRLFVSPKQPIAGFLGVMLESRDDRVVIREVIDGPAKRAGLEPGDVVLKIGDQPITTVPEMITNIRSREPGETIRLAIVRADRDQSVEVRLDARPDTPRGHVADLFAGGPSERRTGFDSVFCHDAPAETDECGGPVFDLSGHFVGINVARFSRTRSYALPARTVRDAVQRMQNGEAPRF